MSLNSTCFVSSLIVHEQFFFFCLSSACLSNKPKIKAQAWLIYKQMNMNELFIELSLSCLWTVWFIYNPIKTKMCWKVGDICPLASYIEIISLVNKTLKLSSKLTSRVCEAQVQWRNSSLTGSSFDC